MESTTAATTTANTHAAHLYFCSGRLFWPTGRWPPHAKRARLKFDAGRSILATANQPIVRLLRLNRRQLPHRYTVAWFVCGRTAGIVQLDVKWLRVTVEWRPLDKQHSHPDVVSGFRLSATVFTNLRRSPIVVVERRNDCRV